MPSFNLSPYTYSQNIIQHLKVTSRLNLISWKHLKLQDPSPSFVFFSLPLSNISKSNAKVINTFCLKPNPGTKPSHPFTPTHFPPLTLTLHQQQFTALASSQVYFLIIHPYQGHPTDLFL